MIHITEIERVREDTGRRTPLATAAAKLVRLKTEQLARELRRVEAAGTTTAWNGEEADDAAHRP